MRPNLSNMVSFVFLAAGLTAAWWYVDKNFIPKPTIKPPREAVLALTGAAVSTTSPAVGWPVVTRVPRSETTQKPPVAPVPAPAITAPAEPPELIALGDETSNIRALLTTRGGAVQQLTLNRFDEANRLGREVFKTDAQGHILRNEKGKPIPQPLRLIPGVIRPWFPNTILEEAPFPNLEPGKVTDPAILGLLAAPSYLLLHYPAQDDPQRREDDAGTMNGSHPSPELGYRTWTVTSQEKTADGSWKVVFETDLAAPYFLKLRKIYTLAPQDYHFGFIVEVVPLPGRTKGQGQFRYQIVGPHSLPLEGEWYTSIYRNVQIGWTNAQGGLRRAIEDAATIGRHHGGEKISASDNRFAYAAVTNQFFASALCLDDTVPEAERKRIWDYVRPTREPHPWDDPSKLILADASFRAVAKVLNPGPNPETDTIQHQYLSYNGPTKVVQLGMLTGDRAVSDELVHRYQDGLNLRTLTDFHSPTFFGRLANWLYWSDVVIFMTNIMHTVLFWMHGVVPVWGLNIIMLTVLVRLILLAPSRKQQASMMKLQDKMARLKPEIDKLQERYKDDPQAFNQAKTKFMLENGVNPLATGGGCLLIFAQMPILMGLYFCLQESVFFRLDSFLWMPNLAAPDMLFWWSEQIPFISWASNLGSMFYLGPYMNVLPLVAVGLMFFHQRMTMPPPTDEQQELQQKMMKIMIIFMALFFYKVAAGLCLYFICSTGWALMERKFIPKPKPPADPASGSTSGTVGTPPARTGFMGRLMAKMEEMQKQADEQAKRQIRNDPSVGDRADRGNRDRKRKKR
ncbi:MAG: membrane protein insertase YidC [Bacteroidales bacterium]|nr:membrane protein insertase YidC [Bacteroidales bacterium]